MKKILLISLIALCLVLSGCGYISDYLEGKFSGDDSEMWDNGDTSDDDSSTTTDNDVPASTSDSTTTSESDTTSSETEGCEQNSDCAWDELCIDGECGKIAELYVTEGCTEKCNFNDVVVETSDGQSFTLNRGKGDYTAAGAIEWTLSSGPDYCPGDDIIVPVKIKRKNLGKVVNEEVITVKVGEKSAVVTHPDMKSIKFTFTVKSVNEVCS